MATSAVYRVVGLTMGQKPELWGKTQYKYLDTNKMVLDYNGSFKADASTLLLPRKQINSFRARVFFRKSIEYTRDMKIRQKKSHSERLVVFSLDFEKLYSAARGTK